MMSLSALLVLAGPARAAASGCGRSSEALVELGRTVVIAACDDGVLRVVRTPDGSRSSAKEALSARMSLMVDPAFPASTPSFNVSRDGPITNVTTKFIKATFDGHSIHFTDSRTGQLLTSELESHFTTTRDPAAKKLHNATYVIEQHFSADTHEGLYGGGEFQNGLIQFRGVPIELVQFNTEAAVPFFSSTKGYGVLWDSNAWTYLNPPTGEPLHFKPSSKPFPVTDGTHVGLAPCKAGAYAQAWALRASDSRLAFNGSASAVLDCDGCAAGHSPHLWRNDAHFSANQQWTFTSNGQLRSSQHDTCLGVASHLRGTSARGSVGGNAVEMESCATGQTRWHVNATDGHIVLATRHRRASRSATGDSAAWVAAAPPRRQSTRRSRCGPLRRKGTKGATKSARTASHLSARRETSDHGFWALKGRRSSLTHIGLISTSRITNASHAPMRRMQCT